jgi:SAM-dependent methyltransferase
MAHFTRAETELLERLRGRFLAPAPGGADYWDSEETLALYDRTYGERIGWKWDAVLGELAVRGWEPRSRHLLDWGCGAGVAARRALEAWPGRFDRVTLVDRSPLAMRFAAERIGERFPGVQVTAGAREASPAGGLVVLSHVLNELGAGELEELRRRLVHAEEIVWVEAGTQAESRRLIAEVREPLLAAGGWVPVAPCTHGRGCGLMAPENERHWCHSFGRAPSEAFQDGGWAELARGQGIDLRSLPYSFLVLARAEAGSPGPGGRARLLGAPREYKGFLKVLSCAEEGVCELMLQKRDDGALWKKLRAGERVPVYRWEREGRKIVGEEPEPA